MTFRVKQWRLHRYPYRLEHRMPLVRSTMTPRRRKYLDIAERVFWTAVQAASAVGIVNWFELDGKWVVPIAFGLACLKGVAGTAIGNNATASTLPATADPATPPVAPVVAGDNSAGHADIATIVIALLCAVAVLAAWLFLR